MNRPAYLRNIDFILLLFLLFFTIDMVVLKPLMIVAGLICIWKTLSVRDFKGAPFFYISIIILGIVSFFIISPDFGLPHIISCSLGLGYWAMSLFAFVIVKNRVDRNDVQTTERTIDIYFVLNALWSAGNLALVIYKSHSINPYMLNDEAFGNSTGDYIKGIISGPSYLNMFVNAFFSLYYLFSGRYKNATIAMIIACLTTSNFANFIFIFTLIICFFLLNKKWARITIVAQLLVYVVFYMVISNNNLVYLKKTISNKKVDVVEHAAMQSIELPFASIYPNAWYRKYGKATGFVETFEYLLSGPSQFLFGAGVGRFSSQLAVRTSDIPGIKKSRLFKKLPVYVAPSFFSNHYKIFVAVYSLPPAYHSIRHFPSSFANQLLGEYGFIGLILFAWGYLYYFLRDYKSLTFALPMLAMLCCFLVFDYLFEYLSVVVFFETFFLLNRKQFFAKK